MASTSGARQLAALVPYLLRHPADAVAAQRQAAASLLDKAFTDSSPIPSLAVEKFLQIQDSEVVLPPRTWLRGGNQSIAGLLFLVGLAKLLDARVVFEIGTYNAVTAWTLARNLTKAEVFTLDLPVSETPTLKLGETDASNRLAFDELPGPLPPGSGKVRRLWGDSATFDFGSWRGRCDLVYVDGAHSHAYVASDTSNALELTKGTGAIVWDDYWRRVSGVRDVLDEGFHKELSGSVWRVPDTRLVVFARSLFAESGPNDET